MKLYPPYEGAVPNGAAEGSPLFTKLTFDILPLIMGPSVVVVDPDKVVLVETGASDSAPVPVIPIPLW